MKPTLIATLVLATILCRPATAQIAIEKMRGSSDPTLITDLSYSFRQGFAKTTVLSLRSTGSVDRWGTSFLLLGQIDYGRHNGTRFRDRSLAHIRAVPHFSDRFHGEVFSLVEKDGFALRRLRYLYGAGVRYDIASNEVGAFEGGIALMREHESLYEARLEVHPAVVDANYFSIHSHIRWQISESVSFQNTLYFQPRLDDFADRRIDDSARLTVKINDNLSLTTNFSLRYDSKPPDPVAKTDMSISNGLRIAL